MPAGAVRVALAATRENSQHHAFDLLKPAVQALFAAIELVILVENQSHKPLPSSADEALNAYPSFGQLPMICAPQPLRTSYSGRIPLAKLSG